MIDYRGPVTDMRYTLRHGADVQRLEHWDEELAGEILEQAARLIDQEIAPLDPMGDEIGAVLEAGRAKLPAEFVSAYKSYAEGGWPALVAPEAYDGQAQPDVLGTAISEMFSGAGVGFQTLVSLGQGAIRTLNLHGTEEQKARYLPKLVSGEWLATMCLTEATAGSDLSQVRTTATCQNDGSWRITGTKIFITGGDHNLTDNIVHLVLARTADGAPGIKGLALFVCPAVKANGERNGISVLRLEEKMGLHVSPTCQLAFDAAEAEILGAPGEGLARMFTMMNAARIDVGTQGVGLMEVAAQRSWAYAIERMQGRSGRTGEAIDPIYRHSDVQRMLLQQRTLALGCRAMLYRTAVDLELGDRPNLIEFLTPICKAFSTDSALECANLAIQIHGGYGFTREYRVEQILRDCRITLIYEGTNGIHAMTLAGRLIRLHEGACAQAFADEIAARIGTIREAGLTETAYAVETALGHWREATKVLQQIRDPGLVASHYLRLSGLVLLGSCWGLLERGADRYPNPVRLRALADHMRLRILPETEGLARAIRMGSELTAVEDQVFVD